jgi:hypothetical protein
VSTSKPFSLPSWVIAATPSGIDAWWKPAVLVKTSTLGFMGAKPKNKSGTNRRNVNLRRIDLLFNDEIVGNYYWFYGA